MRLREFMHDVFPELLPLPDWQMELAEQGWDRRGIDLAVGAFELRYADGNVTSVMLGTPPPPDYTILDLATGRARIFERQDPRLDYPCYVEVARFEKGVEAAARMVS